MPVSVPLASEATGRCTPDARSALRTGTGLPIIAGPVDSVVGVVTDTVFGVAGAVHAAVGSVPPVCPAAPAHARIRR